MYWPFCGWNDPRRDRSDLREERASGNEVIIFQDSADISVAQPGLGRCYLVLSNTWSDASHITVALTAQQPCSQTVSANVLKWTWETSLRCDIIFQAWILRNINCSSSSWRWSSSTDFSYPAITHSLCPKNKVGKQRILDYYHGLSNFWTIWSIIFRTDN